MRRFRDRMLLVLAVSIIASTAIHVGILVWLARSGPAKGTLFGSAAGRTVEMEIISRTPQEAARDRAAAADARRKARDAEEKAKFQRAKRIVDVNPTPGAKPPEDARFLAEKNARAEKETVSRNRSLDYGKAQPTPQQSLVDEPGDGAGKTPLPPVAVLAPVEAQGGGKPARGAPEVRLPEDRRRERLELELDPDLGASLFRPPAPRGPEVRGGGQDPDLGLRLPGAPAERQEPGFPGAGQGIARLLPSAPYGRGDGAPAPDHLPEVDEGEATALNAAEFKYATFFNRFKQEVAERWHPGSALAARDPSGRIYGMRDRYTLLQIVLGPEGGLEELWVDKSSGLDFLDQEAMNAVRRAQPFPNPPRGLLDDDGRIAFGFGFHVEMGPGAKVRLFRRGY